MLPKIINAIITFTATNIDDIVVLMMFFSQTDHLFRPRHIIMGQYLGFMALVAISLLGFLGSFFIPKELIGLLGLVPIAIGVRQFVNRNNEIESTSQAIPEQTPRPAQGGLFHPKIYSVSAVTFANGGDNIGIYTPLFASLDLPDLIITLITFLVLVMLWCLIGIRLTHQKHVALILSRYGHIVLPFVLIALGLYIIIESGTLNLFGL